MRNSQHTVNNSPVVNAEENIKGQLIRHEALYDFIVKINTLNDINKISKTLNSSFKYIADIKFWKLIIRLEHSELYIIDNKDNKVNISNISQGELSEIEREVIQSKIPKTLHSEDLYDAENELPSYMTSGLIASFIPHNKNLFIVTSKNGFNLLDKKFINLVVGLFSEKVHSILSNELLNDKLLSTQKQLLTQEKNASVGRMVVGVSHEINTPIGISITVGSHIMDKTREILSSPEIEIKQKDINEINRSSKLLCSNLDRVAKLIEGFKQVSVDQISEQKRQFNVKDYFSDVIWSLGPVLNKIETEVIYNAKDDLIMDSYPGLLTQVITNLATNASLHAFKDKTDPSIKITVEQDKKNIFISFSDNGSGISQGNMDKLYDVFFTTRRGEGSTGIGLYIVHNIVVSQLNGALECNSTVGEGTVFSITLPIKIN